MSKPINTVANALSQIEKRFGMNTVVDKDDYAITSVNTGSMLLNAAIGVGGWPESSLIEVYGGPDAGKSTLCLLAVANAQKEGRKCAFIDAEKRFDPRYAKKLGVDIDELVMIDPDTGEDGLEIVRILAGTEDIGVIVVDSVAALMPQIELNTAIGDEVIGVQARMMSEALKKLCNVVHENKVIVLFTNQMRWKLPDHENGQATPTTTGGNALKHYARVRVELQKAQDIVNARKEIVGSVSGAKIILNKVGNRGAIVPLYFMGEYGLDTKPELFELGLRYEVISAIKDSSSHQNEPFYVMNNLKIGDTRNQAIDLLIRNESAKQFLLKALREKGVVFEPVNTKSKSEGFFLEHEPSASNGPH